MARELPKLPQVPHRALKSALLRQSLAISLIQVCMQMPIPIQQNWPKEKLVFKPPTAMVPVV